MNRDDLLQALQNDNVQAFLRVIRAGETSQDGDAFSMLFGGERFEGFEDHPRRKITKPLGRQVLTSTAAGAYQFLARTWDGLVRQYGFQDFSPISQDLAAVALIAGRKALADVIAGRFEEAVKKCAREWASLPGSPYGQPVKTMAQARAVYEQWGGLYAPQADAAESAPHQPADPAPVTTTVKEPKMAAPFLLAALPSLIDAVPKLARLFGSGSEVSERNISAVETVVAAAKDAIGARNEQELVEAIKAGDPATIQAVQQAVHSVWHEISVDTGGIKEARDASERNTSQFWLQPAFWITLLLIPLAYFVVYRVMMDPRFSSEIQSMVIAAIISGMLSGITGYWLGTSFSSSRKTEILRGGAKVS